MVERFISKILDELVSFWNTYDLNQIERLFLKDDTVTYFSFEKHGLIKGYDELIMHHEGFGFVKGGKVQFNKLWLEKVDIEDFGVSSIVCVIWFFKRQNAKNPQKEPVTIVNEKTPDGFGG